jgi:hypothetical protein
MLEQSTRLKLLWYYLQTAYLYLFLQYMHDRAWWVSEAGIRTTVNHGILTTWRGHACWRLTLACHRVFLLLLRFYVYDRSVMRSTSCTAPKDCLRMNLGSRFIVCGFSSDPSWMLRQQIKMKTEDTTKHAAFSMAILTRQLHERTLPE